MVLKARGLAVAVSSPESPVSDRGRLVEEAGSRYLNRPEGPYDIIIEAAGAVEAATAALEALGPSGVLVILGVNKSVEVPMLRLIVRNQAMVGSVNAAPENFRLAVDDWCVCLPGSCARWWRASRSRLSARLSPDP